MTPVSRLAWQDLLGVPDPESLENNTSPNERLLWHTNQDSMDVSISPLVPRRGKKRARSSSPLSSPAVEKLRTPAVNVKKLKQALKSPRADPALDLWDRFAVGGQDSKNPLGATNPAFAHLMASSSPRPQKEDTPTHGESSLRRAISCGSHWPKRRRVEAVAETGEVRERGGTTKSSMVTALLETVNGEINKSDDMEDSIGMESPSIKKRRSPRKPTVSPNPVEFPQVSTNSSIARDADSARELNLNDARTPTSDYGDEEFDDNTLLELDASLLSGQVEAGSFTTADSALAAGKVEQPKQEAFFDDSEFDDDMDDDLLAAAEGIAAEMTPKRASGHVPAPVAQAAAPLDGGTDDSDDVFGDDFGGDFDFEAAELAATQSVGQSASSLMPVRTIL